MDDGVAFDSKTGRCRGNLNRKIYIKFGNTERDTCRIWSFRTILDYKLIIINVGCNEIIEGRIDKHVG